MGYCAHHGREEKERCRHCNSACEMWVSSASPACSIAPWISVKDQMPAKERRHVIVASPYFIGGSGIGVLYKGELWTHSLSVCLADATHWMPLPKYGFLADELILHLFHELVADGRVAFLEYDLTDDDSDEEPILIEDSMVEESEMRVLSKGRCMYIRLRDPEEEQK